jgi:hypothetical protein
MVGGTLPTATIHAKLTGVTTLTLKPGVTATTTATITNTSASADAIGCFVSMTRPLLVNSGYKAVGLPLNHVFTVPKQTTVKVSIHLKPRPGFAAKAATEPVLFKCTNTAAAPITRTGPQLVINAP